MKARHGKGTKNGDILTSVAESIGSALGTIAAKAGAAQRVLTPSRVLRAAERQAQKVARKGKSAARKTTNRAARTLTRSKAAKAAHRGLRRARAVKRSVKRATSH
jgi:hypothetical protein